jgi:hypothetical protein
MASLAIVRSQVENRAPGALKYYERSQPETVPTGIAELDERIGGIPKSAFTQICGPHNTTLGKATLLVSIMAQLTLREECCALVDAGDCFDPASSQAAGLDLSRVLWVRCGAGQPLTPLEQAFKAADILLQNGGFSLVALDLANIAEAALRRVPLTTWFRFARVVERMSTALLVVTSYPAAKSCASLTLLAADSQDDWANTGTMHHARTLSQVSSAIVVGRTRAGKPAQSVHPRFTAQPAWR